MIFEHNKLTEIIEDLSETETFKKMKKVSDNYWRIQKSMENYTVQSKDLLDYLDEAINNPYVEPDLKFIKESFINIQKDHSIQISSLEMFSLINWKQTILNNMEDYVKVIPENYKQMLDQDTKIEIQDILDDLKWQSSNMHKVIIDNIETFQRSYFDLQTPLVEIDRLSDDIAQTRDELEPEFNKIWDYQDHEKFNDDFALDLEDAFVKHFKKLEDITKQLTELMNNLTMKFKDKESEITKKFAQNNA